MSKGNRGSSKSNKKKGQQKQPGRPTQQQPPPPLVPAEGVDATVQTTTGRKEGEDHDHAPLSSWKLALSRWNWRRDITIVIGALGVVGLAIQISKTEEQNALARRQQLPFFTLKDGTMAGFPRAAGASTVMIRYENTGGPATEVGVAGLVDVHLIDIRTKEKLAFSPTHERPRSMKPGRQTVGHGAEYIVEIEMDRMPEPWISKWYAEAALVQFDMDLSYTNVFAETDTKHFCVWVTNIKGKFRGSQCGSLPFSEPNEESRGQQHPPLGATPALR